MWTLCTSVVHKGTARIKKDKEPVEGKQRRMIWKEEKWAQKKSQRPSYLWGLVPNGITTPQSSGCISVSIQPHIYNPSTSCGIRQDDCNIMIHPDHRYFMKMQLKLVMTGHYAYYHQ